MSIKIRYITILFVLCAEQFISLEIWSQTPPDDPHWELLWEDNFNFLDASRWDVAVYADHSGEPQLFLPENVSITSEGELKLLLDPNPRECDVSQSVWGVGGGPCQDNVIYPATSGWIETNALNDVRFGYIEARVKMPRRSYQYSASEWGVPQYYHTWPAFWTWRGQGDPVNEAEIDVAEAVAKDPNTEMGANLHWDYDPDNPFRESISPILVNNYTDVYRTYGVQWDADKIIWYYDGMPVRTYANHGIVDPVRIILAIGLYPDEDMKLIYPKPAIYTGEPCAMFVDYVRVYKLKKACDQLVHTNALDYISYPGAVVNYVSLGGDGIWNQPVGPAYIRGSNFVELTPGYTIPNGSDIHLEAVKECQSDLSSNGLCNAEYRGCLNSAVDIDGETRMKIEIFGDMCQIPNGSLATNMTISAQESIVLGGVTVINPTSSGFVLLSIQDCD